MHVKSLVSRIFLCCLLFTYTASSEPQEIPEETFTMACIAVAAYYEKTEDRSCDGLLKPKVLYSEFIERGGLYLGLYYGGSRYIVINVELLGNPELYNKVLLHEVVHYVEWFTGGSYGVCQSEELARLTTSIFFDEEYTDDWKKRYNCDNDANE